MNGNRQSSSPSHIAAQVALWIWAAACVFPLYWLAIASVKSAADLSGPPRYVPFLDFTPTLSSWRFILADPTESLVRSAVNSLVIAVSASVICVLAAGLAVHALTRHPRQRPLAGQHLALPLMMGARAVPPVVLALPIHLIAASIGLLDSHFLLIGVYAAINLPVALWLLVPVLGDRPSEQEEAAQLDGASHAAVLWGILMPMVRLQVAVTGLLIFLLCWNEYLFAAYLATDHAQTLTPWMAGQLSMKEAQAGGEGEELAHMSAAAVFMALPAILIAALIHRRLSRTFWARRDPRAVAS